MTGEKTNKQDQAGPRPAETRKEPSTIRETQRERDRRIQEALEDDEVQEALESLRACKKNG